MTKCAFIPNFFKFYNMLWGAALPFLKRHPRLTPTFGRRINPVHLRSADIWIQAASAGEAYLAVSIIKALNPDRSVTMLLTTTTDQGMKILTQALSPKKISSRISLCVDIFPFDKPTTMNKAVQQVNPAVMVLLETELWPAHLYALKKNHTAVLLINGRLSQKSYRNYGLTKAFWRSFAPERILAISAKDAKRFSRIFSHTRIDTMDNIKFDRMKVQNTADKSSALAAIVPRELPLSIFASFRRQEEKQIIDMIKTLLERVPNQIIALFPRHMHRIAPFLKKMNKNGLKVYKGSQISSVLPGPAIILWDKFGDLHQAYSNADVVFVGGSLAPLGGQNFMEPAGFGIPTIIGPHWQDFAWVGKDIFNTGAVTRCRNWHHAVKTMCSHLLTSGNRQTRIDAVNHYILQKQGGAQTAADTIWASWVTNHVEPG
ncbi:3-deoxy-D-manno-octulosonic acid transferase [Desulfobacter hydrogenophilus]|uniref:3-deoxy-D-manno-octulosonic acid transferase n=1 Tax=Desulfobacter hydrogenophilus TaxID=2291 RepID=A0A328FIR8_9BACT|nr:glycosyltransferase N-terminal domain-containing protein [Desulfobacter hydrogenophilus]NDY71032.1 3-deoxy-D-manno-octulosonic acid transferase [Desulfobacter hydrogenophilus]QBH11675.1 3-deoxy-D-manno-octulosonic acid transferase [Desulfobacter hydrogenophilus]RAM02887.1 3-deoxy-D-manno-octulosonic acid transferase [Desulfobacter hydrogenophilus]